MTHLLDDPAVASRLDPQGMLKAETSLPESCLDALRRVPKIGVARRDFRSLTVAGMGGSAIGGVLLRDWLYPTCPIPISVTKHSELPAHVDADTLLFVVSYSGNTEETLSSLECGLRQGAQAVVFTSGGRLEEEARSRGLPLVTLPPGFQPRAALPHQFFSLASVAHQLGLAGPVWGEVDEAIRVLTAMREELRAKVPYERNPAKKLAASLQGFIPLVYGSSLHEGVAYRASTQLNENGKTPAGASYFPEAFHNAIMAGEGDPRLLRHLCAVLLLDPMEGRERAAKIQRFRRILEPRVGRVQEFTARGEGRLARILSALYFCDYASIYLAFLYGKDPGAVDSITELKRG